MPYQREAELVLALWREAERTLARAIPDSAEADALRADAERLREEYQRLIGEAVAHHRPVPPPFPDLPAEPL